jgi:hypothetical protein
LTKWKLNFFFVLLFFFTYCIINIQKTAHYISKNSKKNLARGPPRLLSSIYYVHDDYYHFHEEKEEEEEETLAFILAVLCINDRGLRFPCNCCQQRNVGGGTLFVIFFQTGNYLSPFLCEIVFSTYICTLHPILVLHWMESQNPHSIWSLQGLDVYIFL